MKKVYLALSADFLHEGHLKVINKGQELGEVTVGVMTDSAIAKFKNLPLLDFEQRKNIISNIRSVSNVIAQTTLDYTENLISLKPDYVVHGDDWKTGPQSTVRQKVIETLKQWGGELIEIPYSYDLSSSKLNAEMRSRGTTASTRQQMLKRLINSKSIVRILEAHNGLTGLIAEQASVEIDGETRTFDGIWESSLTDSTSKGKPDTGAVDITSRVASIDQILEVTTKPMIVDADSGGLTEHFCFTVRTLERLGVSAVIIEDKVGPKRNSLFGTDVKQTQDDPDNFANKISQGKKSQVTQDFMIIARVESLILKKGHDDAIMRATKYVEAGADGIMIHSKEKSPDEVVKFCNDFKKMYPHIPIIVVPTSYSSITEKELSEVGVNVVIYANHMLRSAFPAMMNAAKSILSNERCKEASQFCMPIKEIITLVPEQV